MSFKEWKISSTVIEPVELIGEVFDLKAVATFFDKFEKKSRKKKENYLGYQASD
jgi:hypothetical protein